MTKYTKYYIRDVVRSPLRMSAAERGHIDTVLKHKNKLHMKIIRNGVDGNILAKKSTEQKVFNVFTSTSKLPCCAVYYV